MYRTQLESMLVQHVFPEFKSPLGYLRARVGKEKRKHCLNPLSPKSDQHQISPCNITAL